MWIEVVRSKIHRIRVTKTDLNYVGSIGIDEVLLEAAGIYEHQKVQVVNLNNGERLDTYVIASSAGSGEVCLNGAAARKSSPRGYTTSNCVWPCKRRKDSKCLASYCLS